MTCCFIGHRKIEDKQGVAERVKKLVRELVEEKGVKSFHFGSRSEFDDICHAVVTELQKSYPDIVRINYNRKSEYVVKKGEGKRLEGVILGVVKRDITLKEHEDARCSTRISNAGKASYVERNEAMIDDSEYCVFFYEENYAPSLNGGYKSSGRSGTRLAYEYALRKKKKIINVAKEGTRGNTDFL